MSEVRGVTSPGRVPGIETLADCPSAKHVAWIVARWAVGAPAGNPSEFTAHSAERPERAEFACRMMANISRGPSALVEVVSWRGSAETVVVEYRARDGRDRELHFDLAADGRVHTPRQQRALGGIDVSACTPAELAGADRAGVLEVFDDAYEDGDGAYVVDQLERFGSIALARLDREVVGFFICDTRSLELPVIGAQACIRQGLSCVRPNLRRSGLMLSMASAASLHASRDVGGVSLQAVRLASPSSANAALSGLGRWVWPPRDDPFALHDHPTQTQRAVAAHLASSFGATGYDADTGVCIGTGRRIGSPRIEHEVTPDLIDRFRPVDRTRGDTLLWITWATAPPAAWGE